MKAPKPFREGRTEVGTSLSPASAVSVCIGVQCDIPSPTTTIINRNVIVRIHEHVLGASPNTFVKVVLGVVDHFRHQRVGMSGGSLEVPLG